MSEERHDQDDPRPADGEKAMPELWRERRHAGASLSESSRNDWGAPGSVSASRSRGAALGRSVDLPQGQRPGGRPMPWNAGFWWPMRGRWKWAGLATLVGVLLGLGAGYGTSTLRYAVDGRVELRSMHSGGSDRPAATPEDVRGVVDREAVLLGESADAFVTEDMAVSVTPTSTTGLNVSIEANDPSAAEEALRQALETYDSQTTLHAEVALAEEAQRLLGELDQLRATRDDLQRRIDTLSWEDGVALIAALETAQRELATQTERLERTNQWFDDSNRLKVSRDTALIVLAENDTETADLLIERAELLIEWIDALAERRRGVAAELKERFVSMVERIDAIAADTRVLPAAWVGAPQDERRLVAVRLSEMREQRATLEMQIQTTRENVAALEATHRRVMGLEDELREARRRTQVAEESFARLADRPAVVMKLVGSRVVADATREPVVDDRAARSALGAALGGLLGLLGVVVAAFVDPRLRRADPEPWAQRDAPLVGVVPDVNTAAQPTSDPKQAAAIQRDLSRLADAVHAIRAVVEAQLDGRTAQTVCVTSASAGSGKTSLTIGLASSLVMGGLRVLVVDAALTDRKDELDDASEAAPGSGLTKDLEPTGQTLEAALGAMGYLEPEDRDLLAFPDDQPVGLGAYLRGTPITTAAIATRVQGLSLLGAAHIKPGDAGRLSRTFLERMSRDAAEHFDVVLFDTGTIPRCVEALFVAGACRGVLLVVGRDEPRRKIDAALQKLRMVGAPLLGTVFNRELQTAKFREKYAAPAEGSPMLDPSWRNQGSGMFAAAVRTHGGQDGTVDEPVSQTGMYRSQAQTEASADTTASEDTAAGPIDFAADDEPLPPADSADAGIAFGAPDPTDAENDDDADVLLAIDEQDADTADDFDPLAIDPNEQTAISFEPPIPETVTPVKPAKQAEPEALSDLQTDHAEASTAPCTDAEPEVASETESTARALPEYVTARADAPSEAASAAPRASADPDADDELIDQFIDSVLNAVGSDSTDRKNPKPQQASGD